MAVKYNYDITDFLNNEVAEGKLHTEIEESTLSGTFSYIHSANDKYDIWFSADLSAGEQTTLDGIVSAHDGIPILEPVDLDTGSTSAGNVPVSDGQGHTVWTNAASAANVSYSFLFGAGSNLPYIEYGGSSFATAGTFLFFGTDRTPVNSVHFIASFTNDSTYGEIRLYDITSNNAIGISEEVNGDNKFLGHMHDISNLPSLSYVGDDENHHLFEIQYRVTSGSGKMRLHYFILYNDPDD